MPGAGSDRLNRRDFLIKAALTGTAACAAPLAASIPASGATRTGSTNKPNLLVIMVDQLREPMWSPQQARLDALLPSLARLRQGSVCFSGHYCAATACSPSRASFLTGLYAHQHGVLTQVSQGIPELETGFKTWGSALRDCGYNTAWYGKWHLSNGDLEPYGFDGGTHPDPVAGPGGIFTDKPVGDQFVNWFTEKSDRGPWATTVSFLNPHDICGYPHDTHGLDYLAKNPGAKPFIGMPPNYETMEQLVAGNKPRVQRNNSGGSEKGLGLTPASSLDDRHQAWIAHNNAYFEFIQTVDVQIGRVLDTLDSRPEVRDNTIILFLADHGEMGASHGLRAKGIGVYEEEIRVPLYLKDPTGRYTAHTNIIRPQLVSTVDLYALLLTIASGGSNWRTQPQYSHLADRFDITPLLKTPSAAGRDHILHTAEPPHPMINNRATVPNHTIGYRTQNAKMAIYSEWPSDKLQDIIEGQEFELYDYGEEGGRLELLNEFKSKPALFDSMKNELLGNILPNELRRPLPPALQEISDRAIQGYLALEPANKPRVPKGA